MTVIENIEFNFLCKENINKMSPCAEGKHCHNCNKTVIDFRKRTAEDLTKTLLKNKEICGFFSKEQVNISPIKTIFFKHYAMSLLVSVGLTFFSKQLFAQKVITDSLKTNNNQCENQNVFFGTVAEVLPQYKRGGNEALLKFVKNNVNYPKDAQKGRVFVSFIIDTTGTVTEPKVVRSLNELADKEALRIVRLLEYTPGVQNGKLLRVSYTLPILFNVEK